MSELLVVGGGKMGEALVGGLLAAGFAEPSQVVVIEPVEARRAELAATFPGLVLAPAVDQVGRAVPWSERGRRP